MNNLSIKLQKGVTLLEVLISVLVLAIGILGVAGLQSVSLRSTHTAHERAMAVVLTETLFEVMRVEANAARDGAFNMSCISPVDGTEDWFTDVKNATDGETCAEVVFNDGVYRVTIDWSDKRMNSNSIVVMEMRP
ncbi:type IV pilus modification protein PilV [Rheinheimera baltica]|uniref:type IV pilus modification protein PilV n=1 Tax=Rheinheimera baltica TaxID=67576 RepID=UPI00273DBED4|nr:type IV pilus modification protein PilV [Rheinheimera baltica]MDP5189130.1 type IV pilus modification protein PilV [Rheinheimera baltica]